MNKSYDILQDNWPRLFKKLLRREMGERGRTLLKTKTYNEKEICESLLASG